MRGSVGHTGARRRAGIVLGAVAMLLAPISAATAGAKAPPRADAAGPGRRGPRSRRC
jgi:hypothetical protein